ncbi:transposase [Natronosalvus halobius]|uniref:transposase n=1 Tax=Natronosalvus halobius TaxID=2953746 RepID=UPI0020A1A08D|nr:transposase [Natronosalvus halobius]USZ71439.1 transposase [Natronosalvus halobius]
MSATANKTLEATLAPPTAHKEEKLQDTLETYREALQDAFDSGADTMGGVSEVVTPFNLPYQAKAALCSYVKKLRTTYNAREIDDEHPLRLTNQAATFDHSSEREYEFTWWAPRPGHGTNFWIPLRINPEQEALWHDLLTEDAKAGQIRLQRHRKNWVLHVTVEYPIEEPTTDGDTTPVGLDTGETALITACGLKRGTPTRPVLWSGKRAKHLRKEMSTTLQRLQERDAEWRIDERFDYYQNALTDILEKASCEVVEYANTFENPVIVMEDLTYIRENLDYGKYMNRRLHAWAFARLQDRVEDKATDAGIPVEYVNPAYTSQTCHECGHIGKRSTQAELRCTNDDCHVSTFQADISAAASIAQRVDPWGESCTWKPCDDDSPQDGSGCDTAVRPPKPSAPTQMTLGAYES